MLAGYKLTTKGFLTLALMFFTLFSGLTALLSLWTGAKPASPLFSQPSFTTPTPAFTTPGREGTPSPYENTAAPPSSAAITPPSSAVVITQPNGGIETLPDKTPALPLSPYPDNSLQLMYPFAGAILSDGNEAALYDYLSELQSAGIQDSVLVIEGRAYADEASTDAEVLALAKLRMQQVYDYCQGLGFSADVLPVSRAEPPASEAVVVGVSLVLIERSNK